MNSSLNNDNKTHLQCNYTVSYYSVNASKDFLLTHLTLRATHLVFTIFLICLLYNIHWFCLFFLLILINNCNLSLCWEQILRTRPLLFGIMVKVATNSAPQFFKPMAMLLKTTITFIFIFSFVRLGGNIFLLPFYPRFSVWGERYRPSGHYWIFILDRTR